MNYSAIAATMILQLAIAAEEPTKSPEIKKPPQAKSSVLGSWETKEAVPWKFDKPEKLPLIFWDSTKCTIAVAGSGDTFLLEEGTYKLVNPTTVEASFTIEKKPVVLRFTFEGDELVTSDVTGKPVRFARSKFAAVPPPTDTTKTGDTAPPEKPADVRPPRVVPTAEPLLRSEPRSLPTSAPSKESALDRAKVTSTDPAPTPAKAQPATQPVEAAATNWIVPAIAGGAVLLVVVFWLAMRRP